MTIRLPLSQNKFAVIDDIDKDLAGDKWHLDQEGYASRNETKRGKRTPIRLHVLIGQRKAGRKLKRGEVVDHLDENRLNNRRTNLKVTTFSENNKDPKNKKGIANMPYDISKPEDLPAHVQKLSAKRKKQWVEIFNSSHAACMEKDGADEKKCEASAFRQANSVVSKQTSDDAKEAEFDALLLETDLTEIKAGARNSAGDYKRIQGIHDMSAELGAKCGGMMDEEKELDLIGLSVKGLSYTRHIEKVSRAWNRYCRVKQEANDSVFNEYWGGFIPWPRDVQEDVIIVGTDDKLWSVPYTVNGDDIEFGEPIRVEIVYQPIGSDGSDKVKTIIGVDDDTLVGFGGEVKALKNGAVGGYLVFFSSEKDPDLSSTRDFFTKETDFGTHQLTDVYYAHGLDKNLRKTRLGNGQASLKVDEVGVWVQTQLDLSNAYEKAIYQLAKQGKLGWSSGTASHLVEREKKGNAHWIKTWPLGLDASLTPAPAEGRTKKTVITSLKSYLSDLLTIEIEANAGGQEVATKDAAGAAYEAKLALAKAEADLLLFELEGVS